MPRNPQRVLRDLGNRGDIVDVPGPVRHLSLAEKHMVHLPDLGGRKEFAALKSLDISRNSLKSVSEARLWLLPLSTLHARDNQLCVSMSTCLPRPPRHNPPCTSSPSETRGLMTRDSCTIISSATTLFFFSWMIDPQRKS